MLSRFSHAYGRRQIVLIEMRWSIACLRGVGWGVVGVCGGIARSMGARQLSSNARCRKVVAMQAATVCADDSARIRWFGAGGELATAGRPM